MTALAGKNLIKGCLSYYKEMLISCSRGKIKVIVVDPFVALEADTNANFVGVTASWMPCHVSE